MLSLNPPQYAEFPLGVGKEIFEVGENFLILLLLRVEGAPHQGASKLEAAVEHRSYQNKCRRLWRKKFI